MEGAEGSLFSSPLSFRRGFEEGAESACMHFCVCRWGGVREGS